MIKTNYEELAGRYDASSTRRLVDPDTCLEMLDPERARILDLACGTGNYIEAQLKHFPETSFQCYALDASESMLERAKLKLQGVDLRLGLAAELPYPPAFFDRVICRFAFHHFEHKAKSLEEMARVMRKGAILRMENFSPDHSRDWLIYKYFPTAAEIDQGRFWSMNHIIESLQSLGFIVRASLYKPASLSGLHFLRDIRNRDASQLTLISEKEFEEGYSRMERDLHGRLHEPVDTGIVLYNLLASNILPGLV